MDRTLKETLDLFWGRIGAGGTRLEWLKNAAGWTAYRDQPYRNVRQGLRRRIPLRGVFCWCCQTRAATARHHIVQVQHGGRNIERNIVPICRRCHRKIHPWMRVKPVKESVKDMSPRLVKNP